MKYKKTEYVWVRPKNFITQDVVDALVCEDGSPRWPDAIKMIEYSKYEELQKDLELQLDNLRYHLDEWGRD